MGLARLQKALDAWAIRALEVTAFDPDTVPRPTSAVGQLFTEADIGQNKALTLIHRLNIAFGLDWCAIPLEYRPYQRTPDLLLSSVDSKQARASIYERIRNGRADYWMN